jgi:hypothetical protein
MILRFPSLLLSTLGEPSVQETRRSHKLMADQAWRLFLYNKQSSKATMRNRKNLETIPKAAGHGVKGSRCSILGDSLQYPSFVVSVPL